MFGWILIVPHLHLLGWCFQVRIIHLLLYSIWLSFSLFLFLVYFSFWRVNFCFSSFIVESFAFIFFIFIHKKIIHQNVIYPSIFFACCELSGYFGGRGVFLFCVFRCTCATGGLNEQLSLLSLA